MTELREALEQMFRDEYTYSPGVRAKMTAARIEKALRAAIRKAHTYGCSGKHLHAENEDKCFAAGVAALTTEGETCS